MTTAEFKRLTQGQTRERSDAAPPKRRKKKDHYRAKYAATPTRPAMTAEEKARQRALFSRHGEAIIDIRLPLPNSKNAHWKHRVVPGQKVAYTYITPEGTAFIEAVQAAWLTANNGWTPDPLTGRLRITARFCMARNGEQDVHNRVDSLMDAMEKAKMFGNDSQFDQEYFYRGPVSPPAGFVDVLIEVIPE